jgi:hypothetical protein
MKFECPACGAAALAITCSIDLPAELSWGSDELSVQTVACGICSFRGVSVYEESRRGASDNVHHYCFAAPASEVARLSALLASCPARSKPRCDCAAHQLVGSRDAQGQWRPPLQTAEGETFPIRIAR